MMVRKKLSMRIGIKKVELRTIILKTVKKNKMFSDVHIRLIVSRGLKKLLIKVLKSI